MHTYFTIFKFTFGTFNVAYKRVETLKLLEYFVVVIVCFHHHWHTSPFWAKAFFRSFRQLSLFLAAFLRFLSHNFLALSITLSSHLSFGLPLIVCFHIFIFVIMITRAFVCSFQYSRKCSCRTSSSSLIGGSGAGWEGTALLNHGSYIKFGCLQFVFSVTDFASAAAVAATEATALASSSAKNQASTDSVETCASVSSTVKQNPDGEHPT